MIFNTKLSVCVKTQFLPTSSWFRERKVSKKPVWKNTGGWKKIDNLLTGVTISAVYHRLWPKLPGRHDPLICLRCGEGWGFWLLAGQVTSATPTRARHHGHCLRTTLTVDFKTFWHRGGAGGCCKKAQRYATYMIEYNSKVINGTSKCPKIYFEIKFGRCFKNLTQDGVFKHTSYHFILLLTAENKNLQIE